MENLRDLILKTKKKIKSMCARSAAILDKIVLTILGM